MTEKAGTLRMQPSRRWAVCRPGTIPSRSLVSGALANQQKVRKALSHVRFDLDEETSTKG